jgi:hypothetical protein
MSSARKRSRSSEGGAQDVRRPATPRVVVQIADDVDVVMAKCRELKQNLINKLNTEVEPEWGSIPAGIVEVAVLPASEVIESIEKIALHIAHQVLAKEGFSMDIPSRASSNQIYIKEWDRIVLGGKRSARSFMNVKVRRTLSQNSYSKHANNRMPSLTHVSVRLIGIKKVSHYTSCHAIRAFCVAQKHPRYQT